VAGSWGEQKAEVEGAGARAAPKIVLPLNRHKLLILMLK